MSADVVIRAEALGKKYVIGHEAQREGYTALRDVVVRRAKALVRTTTDMLRGQAMVAGDTIEEFWALRDINFEVKRGEVVGIIGRNGAGKSTLLKILSRITEPTEGQVAIKGRVASLLEVGTGFHPELTGRENIYLNGAILGMSRAEIRRKFDEIVAFAEVEKFLDTPVKRYSSGMSVRLAFAVAAHLEPEVLILDEVLAVGDLTFQKKCAAKMEDVAGHGRTIVFVSHNMAPVRSLCTRVNVLDRGRIVKDGDVESAIDFYISSALGGGSSIAWSAGDAPRCPQAVLRKAYVLDQYGEPASLIDCRSDFSIVVEYEILEAVKQFRVAALIQNGAGVYVGGSTDWGAWPTDIRGPGLFRSVCRFPGNVLNHGIYSVAFAVDSAPHLEPHLRTDYCLVFTIEDTEGHGPLALKLPGIIKPLMEWNVSQEDECKKVAAGAL
jgi:lipopolysaccharide transport system ATP-binding protein